MLSTPQPDLSPRTAPGSAGLALVTGGAQRLGRAIALELARQHFAIALHYHQSGEQAEETASELRGIGAPVTLLKADLVDPHQIAALFEQVQALPQPLRILVNSAAVMPRSDLMQVTPAEWDATLGLNLRAPLLCSQQAARIMPPGGLIVNITDSGAHKTWTGFPSYVVSKAALETLTLLLARSLAPNIRVNAIAPGLILPSQETPSTDWERLVGRVPLQRAGLPEEIGRTVAFLLQNEYITGQTIVVDGGYQIL